LFAASSDREEKNFKLAEEAFNRMSNVNTRLHILSNIDHSQIPYYYNASDIIILSSLWEGSPNVIKEAMACNRPVVSTNVGDVKWLFGEEPGHYLAEFNSEDFSLKMNQALVFAEKSGGTKGRERIIKLGLDSQSVADRITEVYNNVLGRIE
jgi:glycosyltransferase involved in cell wall biosynthesis